MVRDSSGEFVWWPGGGGNGSQCQGLEVLLQYFLLYYLKKTDI